MHESAILEINSEVEVDEYLNGPLQNEVKAKRMRMEVTHARDTSVSKAFPPKHAVFRIFNTTVIKAKEAPYTTGVWRKFKNISS